MNVDRPISWSANEVGMPVLLLLSISPEYIFHSGANDSTFSFKTMPQELQTVSLVSTSKMMALTLQLPQNSVSLVNCDSFRIQLPGTFCSTGVNIKELIDDKRERLFVRLFAWHRVRGHILGPCVESNTCNYKLTRSSRRRVTGIITKVYRKKQ
jgi:hypothetical protein